MNSKTMVHLYFLNVRTKLQDFLTDLPIPHVVVGLKPLLEILPTLANSVVFYTFPFRNRN